MSINNKPKTNPTEPIPSVPNLLQHSVIISVKSATPDAMPLSTTDNLVNNPLFNSVKDIMYNLVLNIPGLRSKLNDILNQPNMIVVEINKVYNEILSNVPESEIIKLRNYIAQDSSRVALTTILQTSFQNIMADGKIDMNDATHFLNLIHNIVTMFNESSHNTTVNISGESVLIFLKFILKCVLVLCLTGEEEELSIRLLDTSFKLISLTVMPLMKLKCSCNPFQCLKNK
jgi:hypothetical protein